MRRGTAYQLAVLNQEGSRYPIDPNRAMKARGHYWRVMPECDMFRAAIKTILLHPMNHRWTVQGFGFIRTYLPFGENGKRFRLNVWDSKLTVPNVSIVHDHPWHFTSWIINGDFRNVRYVEDPEGDAYECMTIVTGEVGGPVGLSALTTLRALPEEFYTTGDIYRQDAKEIHKSVPADGTVTINDRERVGDGEHARVFWPALTEWGDAIPREATEAEIAETTYRALEKWHDEIPLRWHMPICD